MASILRVPHDCAQNCARLIAGSLADFLGIFDEGGFRKTVAFDTIDTYTYRLPEVAERLKAAVC